MKFILEKIKKKMRDYYEEMEYVINFILLKVIV